VLEAHLLREHVSDLGHLVPLTLSELGARETLKLPDVALDRSAQVAARARVGAVLGLVAQVILAEHIDHGSLLRLNAVEPVLQQHVLQLREALGHAARALQLFRADRRAR